MVQVISSLCHIGTLLVQERGNDMNSIPNSNRVTHRIAIVAGLVALAVMAALMALSLAVSNDALSRPGVNDANMVTTTSTQCGMSEQAFIELPRQVQDALAKQCDRPPALRP